MEEYCEVILRPQSGCTGLGLVNVLQTVAAYLDCHWCVFSDVDLVGAEDVREALLCSSFDVQVRSLDESSAILRQATQIVWATVFLCRSSSQALTVHGDEDYVDSLRKSNGLVRAVDGSEYFVYFPVVDGKPDLLELFDEQHRRRVRIDRLNFPE